MADKKKIKVGSGEDEKDFVLQHPGNKWALDHEYNCTDRNGNIKPSEFVEGILDHVVIKPGDFGLEDFDSVKEIMEFQQKIRTFL